jgi:hypothetical protein
VSFSRRSWWRAWNKERVSPNLYVSSSPLERLWPPSPRASIRCRSWANNIPQVDQLHRIPARMNHLLIRRDQFVRRVGISSKLQIVFLPLIASPLVYTLCFRSRLLSLTQDCVEGDSLQFSSRGFYGVLLANWSLVPEACYHRLPLARLASVYPCDLYLEWRIWLDNFATTEEIPSCGMMLACVADEKIF